ncbi:hypothetical protein DFH07DRAFT_272133 [Mycena maculata]|uniref:Uncharacterized protein n=1 Tax=Mycena maculata TaxID=230809 RepID=A0AAD7NQL0_9AGAR|nr:hypothetical protein DFH07DRAFT_272133 [Mycena maculata]
MNWKKQRRINLTVRITYAPSKAARFLDMPNDSRIGVALRLDLDRFKLPHPPTANIKPPTIDGIEFFYQTRDDSPLFQAVLRTFCPVSTRREFSLRTTFEIERLKEECSIENMTLEETDEEGRMVLPDKIEDGSRRAYSPPSRRAHSPPPRGAHSPPRRTHYRAPPSWASSTPRRPLSQYNRSPEPPHLEHETVPKSSARIEIKKSICEDRVDHSDLNGFSPPVDSAEYYGPPPPPPAVISENTSSIVARLTHEYWNTHRDMANAAARGKRIESQLRAMGTLSWEDENASGRSLHFAVPQ